MQFSWVLSKAAPDLALRKSAYGSALTLLRIMYPPFGFRYPLHRPKRGASDNLSPGPSPARRGVPQAG
jgi:hypothetical protein